jgi:hypothetical protein
VQAPKTNQRAGIKPTLIAVNTQVQENRIFVVYAITTRIQIKKTEYDIFLRIVKEQPITRKSEG